GRVPVAITSRPVGTSLCPGGPVTFTVGATGSGQLRYQWRKNGKDIPGATANSHSLNKVSPGDAGTYDVLVSGFCDSVLSAVATLQVDASAPTITQCASDKTLTASNCQAAVPDLTKEVLAKDDCTPAGLLVVTQVLPAGT